MELIASRRSHERRSESAGFHDLIHVATARETEFVDITDPLQSLVARSGIDTGFLNVQVLHTTAAIVVNEQEPLLLTDFASTLEAIAPRARPYQHDQFARRTVNLTPEERVNGHAHCRALLLNASVCLNVAGGRLVLGRWQRVFLAELDGPQHRTVSVAVIGQPSQATHGRARASWTEDRFRDALGAVSSTKLGAGL